MLYDLLFGTFVYRPGVPPAELGVADDSDLPPYERYLQVRHRDRQERVQIALECIEI